MIGEKFPFSIALGDTVEHLLNQRLITLKKKNIITDKRCKDIYPGMYNLAPDKYEDIIKFIYEQGDLTSSEANRLIEEVNRPGSIFQEFESDEFFWRLSPPPTMEEYNPRKGFLCKRTKEFLENGAIDGEWHQEFILACKDLKAQRYTQEEAELMLFEINHHLTKDDLYLTCPP